MDWSVFTTAIVGVFASGLTGLITWLFSRKKYNSEVDHNNIENMENSLEFYEKLSNSNNKILSDILERSEKLAESNLKLLMEVQNLKAQVDMLVKILQTEIGNVDLSKYGIIVNNDGTIARA
jgi:aminopeptidase C